MFETWVDYGGCVIELLQLGPYKSELSRSGANPALSIIPGSSPVTRTCSLPPSRMVLCDLLGSSAALAAMHKHQPVRNTSLSIRWDRMTSAPLNKIVPRQRTKTPQQKLTEGDKSVSLSNYKPCSIFHCLSCSAVSFVSKRSWHLKFLPQPWSNDTKLNNSYM